MKTVIQFKDQADAIEQLCMKVFGAKPEYAPPAPANEFRYFRDDGDCFWKMPVEGSGFVRFRGESTWRKGVCTIDDVMGVSEISAEEGEPSVAPANGFRYFQRGETVWKMPPHGLGYIRDATEKLWEGSICDLSDMLHNDGIAKYPEISAEEGEP
jgi:hypothetical protein